MNNVLGLLIVLVVVAALSAGIAVYCLLMMRRRSPTNLTSTGQPVAAANLPADIVRSSALDQVRTDLGRDMDDLYKVVQKDLQTLEERIGAPAGGTPTKPIAAAAAISTPSRIVVQSSNTDQSQPRKWARMDMDRDCVCKECGYTIKVRDRLKHYTDKHPKNKHSAEETKP